MGSPQFRRSSERPADRASRTNSSRFGIVDAVDVNNGVVNPFNEVLSNDEDRILEAVSVRPKTELDIPIGIRIVANGKEIYTRYPEGNPVQYESGIQVDEGDAVDLYLRQNSGNPVRCYYALQHREVK